MMDAQVPKPSRMPCPFHTCTRCRTHPTNKNKPMCPMGCIDTHTHTHIHTYTHTHKITHTHTNTHTHTHTHTHIPATRAPSTHPQHSLHASAYAHLHAHAHAHICARMLPTMIAMDERNTTNSIVCGRSTRGGAPASRWPSLRLSYAAAARRSDAAARSLPEHPQARQLAGRSYQHNPSPDPADPAAAAPRRESLGGRPRRVDSGLGIRDGVRAPPGLAGPAGTSKTRSVASSALTSMHAA
jgi:hypothetical protein